MIMRTRQKARRFYYTLALFLTLKGFCCNVLTSAFSPFVSTTTTATTTTTTTTTTRQSPILFRQSSVTPRLWANQLENGADEDNNEDNDDAFMNGDVKNGDVPKLRVKTEEKPAPPVKRRMKLIWCDEGEECKDSVREKAVGEFSHIILNGHATGQVAYLWQDSEMGIPDLPLSYEPSMLLLVKPNDDELVQVAAMAVQELNQFNIHVSMDASLVAKIVDRHGVEDHSKIHLFEARQFAVEGYGGTHLAADDSLMSSDFSGRSVVANTNFDLVCTLGGDGLLMHASMMFQGPVPPVISIAGGSLGFLTQFSTSEMVESIKIALGLIRVEEEETNSNLLGTQENNNDDDDSMMTSLLSEDQSNAQVPYDTPEKPSVQIGMGGLICLSIRMRLDCSVMNPEGIVRARFNVLNEVVIDRGSSPYLAALECFCDDVHLTTVQADGIIFATPTGSTAYSMSAGASVVHPAVPCILVTPICPHVLSFRSMVFPDHVVLRCYVPEDARSDASVAFDGKYRRELHRGDSIQIKMSQYPVPTINRADHSSDWLSSLKRNFNFNARPRQRPL